MLVRVWGLVERGWGKSCRKCVLEERSRGNSCVKCVLVESARGNSCCKRALVMGWDWWRKREGIPVRRVCWCGGIRVGGESEGIPVVNACWWRELCIVVWVWENGDWWRKQRGNPAICVGKENEGISVISVGVGEYELAEGVRENSCYKYVCW